ncbi:MAG TPA: hypothetical protein VGS19_28190 [Streptosporangiaceae bacterium]|nr:hypothetical protein [Streptosporangiaceae bacterium]
MEDAYAVLTAASSLLAHIACHLPRTDGCSSNGSADHGHHAAAVLAWEAERLGDAAARLGELSRGHPDKAAGW